MENFFTAEGCIFFWPVAAAMDGKQIPPAADGAVYFAGELEAGPVKIGFTRDFYSRYHQLQSSHPGELFFLAAVRGDKGDEARYLRRFASAKIRGEWFHRTPEIVAEIAAINARHEADFARARPVPPLSPPPPRPV